MKKKIFVTLFTRFEYVGTMMVAIGLRLFDTLDARGLLVRQRRGASERVVLVGGRPLAQAVKSFEHADLITSPFISPTLGI